MRAVRSLLRTTLIGDMVVLLAFSWRLLTRPKADNILFRLLSPEVVGCKKIDATSAKPSTLSSLTQWSILKRSKDLEFVILINNGSMAIVNKITTTLASVLAESNRLIATAQAINLELSSLEQD